MAKNRIYTFFWISVIIVCSSLTAIMGYHLKQMKLPLRHDLPIFTKQIPLSHNKYGNYLVGLMAQQNKDYARMTHSFERALAEDPDSIKLKKNLYLLKAIQGRMSETVSLAKELNQLKESELLTDYVLIAEAFKNKQYDAAEKMLSQKKSYGPDRILVPALKAWIRVGQKKRPEAEQELKKMDSPQTKPLYHYYQALLALAFDDISAAQTYFSQMSQNLIKGYPSLTSIIFLRDFYRKQNLWKTGQPDFDRIQRFLNESPLLQDILDQLKSPQKVTPQIGASIAFYDVSVALAPLKMPETSLVFNSLALYLAPEATSPKIWGGELLESTGNYQVANDIYQKITPSSDMLRVKMVLNLIADEKYAKAIPLLEQLIQKNPGDGYLYITLGDSFYQTKNYPAAIQAYETAIPLLKSVKATSAIGQALLMLGGIYDSTGQADKAEKNFLEALKFVPNDAIALNSLGYLWLEKRKNIDEAFEMVKRASDLKADDPNIMDSLALGYYLKKDYTKALELAEKSTDQISYSSIAYAHLGDIYTALNRPREARYQYRKALDLSTDLTPKLKTELEQKLNLTR